MWLVKECKCACFEFALNSLGVIIVCVRVQHSFDAAHTWHKFTHVYKNTAFHVLMTSESPQGFLT